MRFLVLLLLVSHYTMAQKFPTSAQPGAMSSKTGLRFNTDSGLNLFPFDGYSDAKAFSIRSGEAVFSEAFLKSQLGDKRSPSFRTAMPGMVAVGPVHLLDETEVANIDWLEFLVSARMDSSEVFYQSILPDSTRMPRPDYLRNPFFRYYPVTGITWDQAMAYCQWRESKLKATNPEIIPEGYTIELRLPTEVEWELYTAAGADTTKFPYGLKSTFGQLSVKGDAANYFMIKHNLALAEDEVKAQIRSVNENRLMVEAFAVRRNNVPAFFASNTPWYIWSGPANAYGIYHLIGNVAEMVMEKGVTKGGSYSDRLEDCRISAKGEFSGASPTVGFRVLCVLKKK